jgi:AcrR family transcriptional regulator
MSDVAANARRSPRQGRSKATVDAILEAATRILEAGESFTTNHVAARAGVSVGTLYQYFPDKAAILHALAARERAAMAEATGVAIEAGVDPARAAIRAQLAAFDGRHAARRAVLEAILRDPVVPGMADKVDAGVAPFVRDGERPVHAFVLSRAIMGVVRAAVLEGSPLLGTPDLEEALVRLVRGYAEASPKRSK